MKITLPKKTNQEPVRRPDAGIMIHLPKKMTGAERVALATDEDIARTARQAAEMYYGNAYEEFSDADPGL